MNLRAMHQLTNQLAQHASNPPGMPELLEAAHGAAADANQLFTERRVPVRAVVRASGRRVRIELTATGPLTKRFTGATPQQVLRNAVTARMPAAQAKVNEALARTLRG